MERPATIRGLVTLIAVLLLATPCRAAVISADAGNQNEVAADRYLLAWKDSADGGNIIGYNLLTGTKFTVCGITGIQSSPDVSNGIFVWQDNRNGNQDIYAYNLADANELPVCTDPCDQRYPRISGNIVVWRDYRNGNYDIYGYDLLSKTEFPICTDISWQDNPAIDGAIVVWEDSRNGNKDIYAYDLVSQTEIPICTNSSDQINPAVSGNIIVWEDSRGTSKNIYGYNLSTQTEFAICTAAADQTFPDICSSVVVWQDNRSGNADIYGYNLGTNSEFTVCTVAGAQNVPAASAVAIAWSDARTDSGDIYAIVTGDDYQSALRVTENSTFDGSTLLASAGGTTLPGKDDIYDIWHILQPPRTGYYRLSLCGSDFDTTLALYKSDFTTLASNDEYCGWQSALTSPKLSPAMTYYIRVAGFGQTRGNYHLLVTDVTDCSAPPLSDINNDCLVNFLDYSMVAQEWLACGKADQTACP